MATVTRPRAPWSSKPIKSSRSIMPRQITPMAGMETPPPMADSPAASASAAQSNPANPANPNAAGNLIANAETPKTGFDRYLEQQLNLAGTRELKGDSSKGFVYSSGPYKGMTKGQAIEKIRAGYSAMPGAQKDRFTAGAYGRDVMTPREIKQEGQFQAARAVMAGAPGAPTMPGTSETAMPPRPMATIPGASGEMSPATAPQPSRVSPTMPAVRQVGGLIDAAETRGLNRREPMPGAINGTPVDLIRAQREAGKAPAAAPRSISSPATSPSQPTAPTMPKPAEPTTSPASVPELPSVSRAPGLDLAQKKKGTRYDVSI